MFSKSRINEPGPKAEAEKPKAPETPMTKPSMDFTPSAPKGKDQSFEDFPEALDAEDDDLPF